MVLWYGVVVGVTLNKQYTGCFFSIINKIVTIFRKCESNCAISKFSSTFCDVFDILWALGRKRMSKPNAKKTHKIPSHSYVKKVQTYLRIELTLTMFVLAQHSIGFPMNSCCLQFLCEGSQVYQSWCWQDTACGSLHGGCGAFTQ